ncbi:MAG: leucine-rich repeat protein, partial [Clostridia bacterium]|nr:leucine-rich repeat protein [Clostridia bacterium]
MQIAKKVLAVFLAVLFVLPGLGVGLSASALNSSGQCGENVSYTFSGGTLTISGWDVTYDYGMDGQDVSPFNGERHIKTVVVSDGIMALGNYVFYNCSEMTSVSLPNSLYTIGMHAFDGCFALENISIPDGVRRIDPGAFSHCGLRSVTLPKSVEEISTDTFCSCPDLTTVNYTGGPADWNKIEMGTGVFYGTQVTGPTCYYYGVEGVENAIGDVGTVEYSDACKARIDAARAAFDALSDEDKAKVSNAGDLTAAEAEYARLEAQATELAQGYTFDKSTCTLTVSGNATIDLLEFSGLDVIRHVVIEQGVTFIGSSAFRRCTGLQSVTIPDSVTIIGPSAFDSCSALQSVTIPGSVTEIADQAFKNCSALMSVTIPNGVQQILKSVFAGCTALQSVTIPDSVTHISSQAFYNCAALTSVTIPDSVTNIGSFAFSGCTALTSVTIPNSVKSIGSSAFFGCSSLTAVYFTGSEAQWRAVRKVSDSFRGTPDTLKVYYYYGVEGATNAINDVGTVEYTPECKAKIDAARAAYDALSDEDKANVTNAADLLAAEAEYARLEAASVIPGDVNRDGALDMADALAIHRKLASLLSADLDIEAGDLNGNSGLDISDASMIQEYLVGERESLNGKKPALPAGNNHVTNDPDVTFAFTDENGSSEVSVPAGKATTLQVPVILSSDTTDIGAALDVQFTCSDGIRITGITETITQNANKTFSVYTNDSTLRANAGAAKRYLSNENTIQIFILTVEIPDTAPVGATYTVGFDDLCQVIDLQDDVQKKLCTTAFTPLTIQITQASYPVTFKSWDGAAVLKEETVTAGGDATPPEIPARMSDATYHYIPGEWTGYTNITAPTTLNAPYTAEAHNFNGNACTVCGRLRNTMANQMEYNNYVACNVDLLSYLESSPALFRMALADHGLAGSTYTDAGDALIDKAMEDLDPLLSEDEFYAAGKHFQWYADKYNGIRQTLDAGLNEIINLGVFGNAREEQKRVAGELAQSGDSAECLALIEAAQKAIDALEYDKTKSLDDNLARVQDIVTTLDSDLTALRKQETDTAAANTVEEKIAAIGDVEYTDESKQKIDAAREAYNDLTEDQKALVSNADDLIAAENAYQLYDDKATFEEYKEALTQEAGDKRLPGDSDACRQLIEEAIAAINSATYDEAQSLQQNKDAVDKAANLTQLDKDLADQRAADAVEDLIDAIGEVELTDESKQKIDDAREAYNDLTDEQKALVPKDVVKTLTDAEAEYELLDNKAQFEQYKEDMKQAAGDKSLPGDSAECNQLIEDAKKAIDDVQYDENNTLQQNKDAVDAAANLAQLDADLAEHRAIHYADFYADGTPVESVPYTIDTKSINEPAVPDKTGYTGTWPSYTLKAGGVRIDAVYETIPYEAAFYADGVLVDTVTYTVETTSIADDEPAVPEKPGHTGAWPDYTLKVGGTRIDAVYEVIMQTVDFDPNGGFGEMES